MQLIKNKLSRTELNQMAVKLGSFVKAVVDVEREIVAVDADLHSDLEAFLLEAGSDQKNLWGINLYPNLQGDDFIEYDSLINLRPSQNNVTRGVQDEKIRRRISEIMKEIIS